MTALSNWPEWIGYLAAMLTTASFVPQAWLTFRSRDVSGISLGMYSAFTAGVALWLVSPVLPAWALMLLLGCGALLAAVHLNVFDRLPAEEHHLIAERPKLLEQRLRAGQKRQPGGGEGHAAAVAFEQARAHVGFELLDVERQRRLRHG